MSKLQGAELEERLLEYETKIKLEEGKLMRTIDYFTSLEASTTTFDLDECVDKQERLTNLFTAYSSIVEVYIVLKGLTAPPDSFLEIEKLRDKSSVIARKSLRLASESAKPKTNPPDLANPGPSREIPNVVSEPDNLGKGLKLPPVTVPIFYGDKDKWTTFHDMFIAVIDKHPRLSAVERLYYLKTYLRDEPLHLIEDLSLTSDAYPIALKTLQDRYENKNSIINAHLKHLVDLKAITKPTSANLREFSTTITQVLGSLKAKSVPIDTWDIILVFILSRKLDYSTHRAFELEQCTKQIYSSVEDLQKFLDKRALALENLDSTPSTNWRVNPINNLRFNKPSSFLTSRSDNGMYRPTRSNFQQSSHKCPACERSDCYNLFSCHKFEQLPIRDRRQLIQTKNRCFNCLMFGHSVQSCRSVYKCRKCGQTHHTMLHLDEFREPEPKPTTLTLANTSEPSSLIPQHDDEKEMVYPVVHHHNFVNSQILLATALVNVNTQNTQKMHVITARCLLDSASQMNFITQEFAEKLGLPVKHQSMEFSTLATVKSTISGFVKINMASICGRYTKIINCAIIDTITTNMPQCYIDCRKFSIPSTVNLADPEFWKPRPIQILLGSEVFYDVNLGGAQFLGHELPTLTQTKLGWVVTGVAPINHKQLTGLSNSTFISVNFHVASEEYVDQQLAKFWEIEEIELRSNLKTESIEAEQAFLSSCKYIKNRYQVDLLFKNQTVMSQLGDSYSMAIKRFFYLERKFQHNPELFKEYKAFIDEYLQLGHATIIKFTPGEELCYFMPHHCVLKESSTTKLRVVFDASAKTTTGLSLNDTQLIGTPVQAELFEILIRFRSFQYAFSCDIEKMYRQVLISPEHRQFQRILWRDKPQGSIQVIQLNTITYGVASAPYLATRVLKFICDKYGNQFPSAALALKNSTYVDDILSGSNDLNTALQTQNQLIQLLESNGFHLRKWCSNTTELLNALPSEDVENIPITIEDGSQSIKTLGLHWDPILDELRISVPEIREQQCLTKRILLSQIMKIFDPLGLLGPVVLKAKLFMQETWENKYNWDDPLPVNLVTRWLAFEKQFTNLRQLKIQRWTNTSGSQWQLHGFCDASNKAYGACFYITLEAEKNLPPQLICAKSRIAPLKALSIPRLELEAAVLLAKLFAKIRPLYPFINKTYLYSDSQITLHRLNSTKGLDILVAHRINTIKALASQVIWQHVPTDHNPADPLSRGVDPSHLMNLTLWWNGPHFLTKSTITDSLPVTLSAQLEITSSTLSHQTAKFWMQVSEHCSTFRRLLGVICYVFRFINIVKTKFKLRRIGVKSTNHDVDPITNVELQTATTFIIRCAQVSSLSDIFNKLKTGTSLQNTSVFQLFPFIDGQGILRISGRLTNSNLPYARKHPIILPASNRISTLIFTNQHNLLLHASPVTTLQQLRLQYWLLGGRREAKRILSSCLRCFKTNAKVAEQLMGSMPTERITPKRAFFNVGIDFAGPVHIKQSRLRKVLTTKGYLAIFVCMVTRAIHIELISDLSTESFLLGLNRFISRRGKPNVLFSDNGTNFQGASNKLKELYTLFQSSNKTKLINEWAQSNQISWKFIPPSAPHMGGLWEAAVKSVKSHLKKLLINTQYTYEELYTILVQIEAVLNSRPICPMSDDTSDLEFLSPGHFLIHDVITSYPSPIDLSKIPNSLKYWKDCQRIVNTFWIRWNKDVLNSYQHRPKWNSLRSNLQEGDLVLVKDENLPCYFWKTARILQTIPGDDNLVRTARIKTTLGEYTRPITKLCPFPNSN